MEEQIIEFVKNNKFLYDLRESQYKNVGKKEKAWAELAKELNADVATVKKKWKGLKDSFRREDSKRINAPSGSAQSFKPIWKWYESLTFLNIPREDRPHTVTNLEEEEESDAAASPASSAIRSKRPKLQEEILRSAHEKFMQIGTQIEERLAKSSMSAAFFKNCQDLVDNSNISRDDFIVLQRRINNEIYSFIEKNERVFYV